MTTYNINKPVEIADNIFWVGFKDQANGLHYNPYLIIDGSEGVLIDPGSPLIHFPNADLKLTGIKMQISERVSCF